ncbi:MAG: ribulose 1,5-bisphosphate carboxylase, partial [Bryobacteraceae bacterium]
METQDSQRIYAEYEVETAFPLETALATMAGEQSSGTFLKIPGETEELKEKSGARVEWIKEIAELPAPS